MIEHFPDRCGPECTALGMDTDTIDGREHDRCPESPIAIERAACHGSWGTWGFRYFAYRYGGARVAEGRTPEEAMERAKAALRGRES